MKLNNPSHHQLGFTLLEVLITLVILAIGLLGLAGLQTTGLKNNHNAYQRSQATQLTYDMIDRMRANKVDNVNYLSATPTSHGSCDALGGCSASQMTQDDLFEWNSAITSALASGAVGTISASGGLYSISITWDDDHDGNNANNPNFQMSFQP